MPATSSHVPDDTDSIRPTIFSYLTGAEEIPGRRADVPEHWYDILDAKSYHQYDLTSSRDLSIFLGLIAEDAISDIKIYTPASLPLKRSSCQIFLQTVPLELIRLPQLRIKATLFFIRCFAVQFQLSQQFMKPSLVHMN
jgi:hypothetical protein